MNENSEKINDITKSVQDAFDFYTKNRDAEIRQNDCEGVEESFRNEIQTKKHPEYLERYGKESSYIQEKSSEFQNNTAPQNYREHQEVIEQKNVTINNCSLDDRFIIKVVHGGYCRIFTYRRENGYEYFRSQLYTQQKNQLHKGPCSYFDKYEDRITLADENDLNSLLDYLEINGEKYIKIFLTNPITSQMNV
uniref:PB1 domain-containing protein n=1 Tax=Parastrongyloides trichosuri TaxID=131310 RepID=A0A0N4ZRB5_PARTI